MTSASGARRYELDHLRVLATLGVIMLHTGAAVVVTHRNSTPDLFSSFNVGNLADSGGRFAVNCFFMASGALLLDPVRRFVLRPQFLRVALPTLTWIVIYAVANTVLSSRGHRGVGGALSDPGSLEPADAVRTLLAGPAVYHLWFVYALLGVYLTVPLLRALTDRPEPQRHQLLRWFLVLWVLAELLPRWGVLMLGDRFPVLYSLPLVPLPTGYVGLFVLGFVLLHYRDRLRIPPVAWAALAAVGLCWTFVATWLAARRGDEDLFAAYHNFGPSVIMFSVGVFGYFVCRERRPGPVWPLVSRLSALSFRIYLLHALVLHVLRFTTDLGTLLDEKPAIGAPLIFLATVVISTLIAWLLDFVRPLRRWI